MGTFPSKPPQCEAAALDEFVTLRRQIHAAPELGGDTPTPPRWWPTDSRRGATRSIATWAGMVWSAC